MNLTDLEPQFIRWDDDTHWHHVDTIAEATGIQFVCPRCLEDCGMVRPGVHSIICWSPEIPDTTTPGPGRWSLTGTGYSDLTLKGRTSDSVHLTGPGCGAHFHITNGEIVGV